MEYQSEREFCQRCPRELLGLSKHPRQVCVCVCVCVRACVCARTNANHKSTVVNVCLLKFLIDDKNTKMKFSTTALPLRNQAAPHCM